MSIIQGISYTITNKEAGLVLYRSEEEQGFIIGLPGFGPGDRQMWTIELLDNGKAYIKSMDGELYIGFEGIPREGVKLVAVQRKNAKVWYIEPKEPPYYTFRLTDTWEPVPLLIEFPKDNLQPGTRAQLGVPLPFDDTNQMWRITPGHE